jgi:hypothetical protein
MPLKLIVLSPTSRMKVAFWTAEVGLGEARLWRRVREAGELTVIVAAVCEKLAAISSYKYRIYSETYGKSEPWEHAERVGSSLALDS